MGGLFVNSGQVESSGSGTIGALNGVVSIVIPTTSSFAFTISGTWAATLLFEGSVDGTTFFSVPAYTTAGVVTNSTTSNTSLVIPVGGYFAVRVRASLYTSGTATVTWNTDSNQNMSQGTATIQDTNGAAITVGQKAMATSVPVVIASDQSAVPVSQSGTWNITNVSGTVSLPTGAATSANQTTEITALQLIDNPVGSLTGGTAGTSSFAAGGIFNTSLPTLTNGQQVSFQMDSSGRIILAPLTNTSIVKAQLQDNAGTAIVLFNTQITTADILNTSGQYRAQNATTSAAEALGGATILANRKYLSITPTAGTIYWGFSNTVTTSTGTPIFKNQTATFAVGPSVHIYIIAGSTMDCRIAEGS